jgi:hypothetical protein
MPRIPGFSKRGCWERVGSFLYASLVAMTKLPDITIYIERSSSEFSIAHCCAFTLIRRSCFVLRRRQYHPSKARMLYCLCVVSATSASLR